METTTMLDTLIGLPDERERVPAAAVLPARLFLGVTFVYAGLQKLTDPQFFNPSTPGFIGRQMRGFVHGGSPLTPLLTHLAIPHAAAFGALIAVCELLVGISALLGLLTRIGALGGLALSLTLYLTATWTVHAYFLGADLPYALGWLTLALAGPGLYALDSYVFGTARRRRPRPYPAGRSAGSRRPAGRVPADHVDRASAVRGIAVTVATLAGGLTLAGVARLRTATAGGDHTTRPVSILSPRDSSAAGPAGTTLLGNVDSLPRNAAASYTDPLSGDPAVLVHLADGRFVAYDAVCTHAGCTVAYDSTQQQLVCPCHGATFDPARGAQVVAGPVPQPLPPLTVQIDAQGNARAAGKA
jgi:thiosulfate dehydrogenase [quinone] large subunit